MGEFGRPWCFSASRTGAAPLPEHSHAHKWPGLRTRRDAFVAAVRLLRQGGIDTPGLDARLLACHAADLSHGAFIAGGEEAMAPEAALRFAAAIERRLAGEPVSRILGYREFYGRSFTIDGSTLDPRPDTETLIEAALAAVGRRGASDHPLKLLDLGTGSGCILITLLAELPQASGVGIDRSLAALAAAWSNACRLGTSDRASFVAGDWLEAIRGTFDLIVANPPYLASADIAGLPAEVRAHDPLAALDGGADGLDAYRNIAARAQTVLVPGGSILLEIGADQADAVLGLLGDAGFTLEAGHCLRRDLAGRPRVVAART
jgi:release factor glutamine methyltransferase